MKRLIPIILVSSAAFFFLYKKWNEILSIAIVLIYMAVFSLLLSPVCSRLERRGIRSSHAAGYAVVGLFLITLLVLAAFIPYLLAQSIQLFKRISPIAAELVGHVVRWTDAFRDGGTLIADAANMLIMLMKGLSGTLIQASLTAATQIGRIAFSLILTYYVLCDRKRIGCHLLLFVPMGWRKSALCALCACRNAIMGYVSGMLKTSAFVAAATAAGLLALGITDAFLLGLLMGIMEILPYIGPVLASIPILLCALMEGGEIALLALVLLILIQQIEGNLITPYFTASSTSVHPFLAIFSVFVCGNLFGLWGILIAVPLMVLGKSLMWSFSQAKRVSENCDSCREKVLCL